MRDRIARLTLNSPETGNALNLELATALAQAAQGLRGSDVGAVILTGAGKAFCVGGDLNYMRDARRGRGRRAAAGDAVPRRHRGAGGARRAGDHAPCEARPPAAG